MVSVGFGFTVNTDGKRWPLVYLIALGKSSTTKQNGDDCNFARNGFRRGISVYLVSIPKRTSLNSSRKKRLKEERKYCLRHPQCNTINDEMKIHVAGQSQFVRLG